jgi:hypothetical protein
VPTAAERLVKNFPDPDGIAFGWRAFLMVMSYNPKLVAGAALNSKSGSLSSSAHRSIVFPCGRFRRSWTSPLLSV